MKAQDSNMASSRLLEGKLQEEPIRGSSATKLDFCKQNFSLLILVGRTGRSDQAGHLSKEIERGIRSWDVDLMSCNLNLYLQEFLSHHTVSFKGAGQRCLRYSNKVLETHVLISPSQEQVHTEVCGLLGSESAHKLLVLAGQSVEDSGELLFHRGLFSPHQLKHILAELLIDLENTVSSLPSPEFSLTLSCPNIGQWRSTLLGSQPCLGPLTLCINPPEVLPAMEALGDFTSLISGSLCPISPFDHLPPPGTVGFLKLSRPCCYVFPAGRGDCAFFAVNGFTVLVDGGSDTQACFWKLVRHLDRVDAVLLTHIGTDNLPGVNAFLERKVAELEVATDVKDDLSKRLISPELGVVFFNAPSKLQMEQPPCADTVLKATDQATLTLKLLKKLEIAPQPMFRPRGVPIEPLTLFQKMGVGQLELYILSPGKTSQEYQALTQSWPDVSSSASLTPSVPLTALASVCALLVWHPACPQEKVVRVLFPGVTPQEKLLEGLEKLKGLAFLQKPTVTVGDLEGLAGDGPTSRTVSQENGRSLGKETAPKLGKERMVREDAKEAPVKGKGKVVNGTVMRDEGKRDFDKTKVKEFVKQKATLSDKNGAKKGNRREVKKDEKTGKRDESGPKRKEQVKKESLLSKPKNESNAKPKKEAKNDSKTVGKKASKLSEKEMKTDSNLDAKKAHVGAEPPKNTLANSDKERAKKSVDGLEKKQQDGKMESEENPCGSTISTPEDMTADFLRLKEETEREKVQVDFPDKENKKSSGIGNEKTQKSRGEDSENSVSEILGEQTVGGTEITEVNSADNLRQQRPKAEDKVDADLGSRVAPTTGDHTEMADKLEKTPKVVGFPSPFKKPSISECADQQDRTPTEYTLLDGALKNSPPSRCSLENQAPLSPDEETVGPESPDSRPNSAGHTPYCLSPDDVWCNRDSLSRLHAQGNILETTEDVQPPGTPRQGEGQPCDPKSVLDSHTTSNPKEKHLTFLSLGSLKEGGHDPSPSATTTTTTHSMPAEVSSPQSTEVDESLSMSFEQGPTTVSQREGEDGMHHSHSNGSHFVDSDFRVGMSLQLKKPPRTLGQGLEMGRPPGTNTLHFEAAAHDVDLCLVSPCEFKHFKLPDSSSGVSDPPREALGPQHHGNNNNPRDTSASESNAPLGTEDCPSTTADGALDSDDEESCSEPSHSFHDHPTHHSLPTDPLPAPLRDSPPLPPQPDSCMPVPQSDSEAKIGAKVTSMRGKRPPGVFEASRRPGSGGSTQTGKSRTGGQSGGVKGPKDNQSATRNSSSSSRTAQTKSSPSLGSKSGWEGDVGVYVDLAYLPSGASCPTVNVDFFRSVRSSCYIISGDSPQREELMRGTLDALFQGKASWPDPMQVTLIPTFESVPMQEWYQQTVDKQRELNITVLGSNSTVAMQDETFPACKIEF